MGAEGFSQEERSTQPCTHPQTNALSRWSPSPSTNPGSDSHSSLSSARPLSSRDR